MTMMTQQPKSFRCRVQSFGLLIMMPMLMFLCSVSTTAAGGNEPNSGLSDQVFEQLSENDLYNNKRAWQALQNAWGKRSGDGMMLDADDGVYVTGHFVPLVVTDGTNTIDWNSFERLANGANGEQQQQQTQSNENETDLPSAEQSSSTGGDDSNAIDKRAWKNLNVAWGKRRQAQGWNKFRGAWGKREPSWNNLKGMWGKRDQWQKLHGGWGKRASLN